MYVVEDDVDIAHLVQHQLQQSGYQVRAFSSGSSVFSEAVKQQPILFMLDIMIPGINGFDLCKQIRANEVLAKTHIIFLTAKGNESDRLAGFQLGADDYITKPFSPRELVARVGAVLRGLHPSPPQTFSVGNIEIDPISMTVKVGGNPIAMTVRELRLLEYLSRNQGRVFTRGQLLDAVWSSGSYVTPRSIDVYVWRLREKIETQPEQPKYLKTVHGAGYRFDVPKPVK